MAQEERILVSVVAPAYNEEENIESIIKYWHSVLEDNGVNGEIVIVNDGSKDRTGEMLNTLKEEFGELTVVNHEVNGGYGKALNSAISSSCGEYVVTIDSDGQFDLAEYSILLTKLQEEKLDLVTGFRIKKQDSFIKVFADRVLNLIIRIGFGLKLKDTNCALKVFKGDIIRGINIESRGFPTPTEILIKLKNMGYKIGEAGISHYERAGGKSQLKSLRTSWQFILFLCYLRFKVTLYRARIINEI